MEHHPHHRKKQPQPSPGRPNRTLVRLTLRTSLLLCLTLPTPLLGKTNYKKWLTQEVIWIISQAEQESFQKLKTDEDREEFIARFWRRRDPTPSTDRNEYLDEHYRRLIFVNKMFQEGTPGWKTDRGRIYILHGPPHAEYFYNSRSVISPDRDLPSTARSPNTIVWVYHQNRTARYYKGEIRAVFQPSTGLGRQNFALSDSKTAQDRADQLSRQFFPASNPNWLEGDVRYQLVMAGPPGLVNAKGADLPTGGQGEFQRYIEDLTYSPGEILEEQEADRKQREAALVELRSSAKAEVFFGELDFALSSQTHYQPSGNWLISFAVQIPPTVEGTEFQVYAVLIDEPSQEIFDEFIDVVERSTGELPADAPPTVRRDSFTAPSGKYRLRVAVREEETKNTGYKDSALELSPAPRKKLTLGTVMLTNRVEILPESGAEESGEQPVPLSDHDIVFQDARLLPNLSNTFYGGSPLVLFLQVWTDSPDATITMNANFIRDGQVVHRLEPRAIQTASQVFANYGTVLPLTDFAPGEYTLQLQLVDHKTKTFEIRRLPFTVIAPPFPGESN